jgi:hypothetical protein
VMRRFVDRGGAVAPDAGRESEPFSVWASFQFVR